MPALSSAVDWQNGDVVGLNARGGFVLDFTWKNGKFSNGKVYSNNGNECKIQVAENVQITDKNGKIVASGKGLLSFDTKQATVYKILPL